MTNVEIPSIRVALASGIVSVQAGCTVVEALVLLNDRAVANGETVEQIAVEVIEHRIRFDA